MKKEHAKHTIDRRAFKKTGEELQQYLIFQRRGSKVESGKRYNRQKFKKGEWKMETFAEIQKLHEMLTEEGIPHTFKPLFDGLQIRVYADDAMTNEIDDCVCHSGSHGWSNGLLETFALSECEGWETAEDVFAGWKKMYDKANLPKNNH